MRAQSFLRKSHFVIKRSAGVQDLSPFLPSRTSVSSRNKCLRPTPGSLIPNRLLSSSAAPLPETNEDPSTISTTLNEAEATAEPTTPPSGAEEPDKMASKARRTRMSTSTSSAKDADPVELPEGLESEILYTPGESLMQSSNSGLPPPEIFEEALDKLLISLHPQNQSRAMHTSGGSNMPIEPTLGLYCPIEGGDNIIDITVHELAFQTGADVLVLDAVQLAAGEWGIFGKAAGVLELTRNPLHFSAPSPPITPETGRQIHSREDQDEGDSSLIFAAPPRMSLSLPKLLPALQGRGIVASGSRKSPSPTKLELFFEALINMPSQPGALDGSTPSSTKNQPRLIYIRDFPTLASSSSSWYPALLNAVRQRRRGLLARSSNVTTSPVAIVFGMSPSITPPWNQNSPGSSSNIMNLLMNRYNSASQAVQGTKLDLFHDWTEGEPAEAARERRLRSRLRKWDKNAAALQDEFPKLSTKQDENGSSGPDIIMIGGPEGHSIRSGGMSIGIGVSEADEDTDSQFFRSAVLVPQTRSKIMERESRMARRREINELTIRMGVGAVGGVIERSPVFPDSEPPVEGSPKPHNTAESPMWNDWGNKIEAWSAVRKVADRAIGSVMVSQQILNSQEKATLTSTAVPWSAVQSAWIACNQLGATRKSWLKEVLDNKPNEDDQPKGGEETMLQAAGSTSDRVVESIKNDPDLDPHEARLLPCIIDANAMTTTFNQVHLPGHTIDAVRTIVSLPLLHPHAFQSGILKEHSMSGCLLFGPPGTGKTLVVRALAKEAGCRMLAISPSDVIDMYVGEGEKLVRAVFSLARKLSPCVVFLDEIDALFGARVSSRDSSSAANHRGIITEFMQEMDGLKSSKEDNVIVIGATNRPFDLDDAILRRLPRRLLVDLPGEKERAGILKILLRDEQVASDVAVDALAKKTDGFSGSDLKHLCVSAALDSVKEHMSLPWVSRHGNTAYSGSNPTPSLPEIVAEIKKVEETSGLALSTSRENAANTDLLEGREDITAEPSTLVDDAPPTDRAPATEVAQPQRILQLHNFSQALKEITPSSSENLGSLADLRKWNEEFGEGRGDRKKRQVWGKGRFGFMNGQGDVVEDGRVAK